MILLFHLIKPKRTLATTWTLSFICVVLKDILNLWNFIFGKIRLLLLIFRKIIVNNFDLFFSFSLNRLRICCRFEHFTSEVFLHFFDIKVFNVVFFQFVEAKWALTSSCVSLWFFLLIFLHLVESERALASWCRNNWLF